MDYRGEKKNKFSFLQKKKCLIKSLKEVNCFLFNLNKAHNIKKIINNK